jgi:hypothetical protein
MLFSCWRHWCRCSSAASARRRSGWSCRLALGWIGGAAPRSGSWHALAALAEVLVVRAPSRRRLLRRAIHRRAEPNGDLMPSNLFAWAIAVALIVLAFEFGAACHGEQATTLGVVAATVAVAVLLLATNNSPAAQLVAVLFMENAIALFESLLPEPWPLPVHVALSTIYLLTVGVGGWLIGEPEGAKACRRDAAPAACPWTPRPAPGGGRPVRGLHGSARRWWRWRWSRSRCWACCVSCARWPSAAAVLRAPLLRARCHLDAVPAGHQQRCSWASACTCPRASAPRACWPPRCCRVRAHAGLHGGDEPGRDGQQPAAAVGLHRADHAVRRAAGGAGRRPWPRRVAWHYLLYSSMSLALTFLGFMCLTRSAQLQGLDDRLRFRPHGAQPARQR